MNNTELRHLVDPEGEERAEREAGARERQWTDVITEDADERITELLFGIKKAWDIAVNDLGKGDADRGEETLRIEARSNHNLADLVAIKEFSDKMRADRTARHEQQAAVRHASKEMEDEEKRGVSGAVPDQSA